MMGDSIVPHSDIPENYSIDYAMDYYIEPDFTNHTSEPKSCLKLQFICSIVMSMFCLIGIVGNMVSFVIFTRQCMQSPINILLAGLSLVDMAVLTIAVPVFVIPGLNICDAFGSL